MPLFALIIIKYFTLSKCDQKSGIFDIPNFAACGIQIVKISNLIKQLLKSIISLFLHAIQFSMYH